MKTTWWLPAALCCAGLTVSAQADDWPQWRGPGRDGLSKETGLLKDWPKDGPKLLWQIKDAGGGFSTPSVVGERLYLISNKGKDEFIQARAVKDGTLVWSKRLGMVGPNKGLQYPGGAFHADHGRRFHLRLGVRRGPGLRQGG